MTTLHLKTIARALGGEVAGRQVLAPGPGHSARDRSLAVRISNEAPDGFPVYSHAGDDWRQCRDRVRAKLGLPSWEPGDERHQQRTIRPSLVGKWDFGTVDAETEDRRRTEDDLVRIEGARAIWNEACIDPRSPPVKDYLASRALNLPDDLVGNVLRYHPECPWRNENTGRTDRIPCLFAAFRSIDDDIVTGIHRIRVDRPERWPKTERRMLGVVHRAAVKLGSVADGKLTVGEGVETCFGGVPARARSSMGARLGRRNLLLSSCRRCFAIDDPRRGRGRERTLRANLRSPLASGRKARVRLAVEHGSDHNDILMQRRVS